MKSFKTSRLVFLIAAFLSVSSLHADPLRLLAKKLKKQTPSNPPLSLAVLDFTYSKGRFSTGSFLVPERLLTYLVQEGAAVIERRLLQKILEEKRLGETGLMKPKAADNMSKVLGVDAVVVGTLRDLPDHSTEVLARVIPIETTKILAVAGAVIPKLWSDEPRYSGFNQMQALVPVYYAQFPDTFENAGENTPAYQLKDLSSVKKRKHYYPAPVPYFRTSSSIEIRGQL